MTESERKARNARKLAELWPAMRPKVAAILADMEGHGHQPRLQCAWRSKQDQAAAYQSGATQVLFGFHNVTGRTGNAEALAADIVDERYPYDEPKAWKLQLLACAIGHGLTTGALYGGADRAAIMKAIAEQRWSYSGEIGWDPWHVEYPGHTPDQARRGWRP